MRYHTALGWCAAVLSSVSLAATPAADRGTITLEDLASVEPLGQPALSPDGAQFALIRGGQIELMPSTGGWPVALTTTPGAKTGAAWAPDGRFIAVASQ